MELAAIAATAIQMPALYFAGLCISTPGNAATA
jgi:hypothetical protein